MNYLLKLSKNLVLLSILIILIGLYFYKTRILLLGLFMLYFLFYFHRVPKIKIIPRYNNPIVSPCYGRVRKVDKTGKYIYISITLSLFDPHIQYIPYDCIIRKKVYKEGEFNLAYFLNKSKYNEKMITIMDTKYGEIIVCQIAGMLTRRIHNFVKPLELKRKCDHLGFITFGSRVDILIPNNKNNIKLMVTKGEYLKGGEIIVCQIAGMLTRRIHNFVKPLELKRKCDHLGFITFGSRVDILIPNNKNNIKLMVTKGEYLKGGESVLCYTN